MRRRRWTGTSSRKKSLGLAWPRLRPRIESVIVERQLALSRRHELASFKESLSLRTKNVVRQVVLRDAFPAPLLPYRTLGRAGQQSESRLYPVAGDDFRCRVASKRPPALECT